MGTQLLRSSSVVLWLMAAVAVGQCQPVIIGYTNCVSVTNLSQSMMTQIGQLKWYFAHASVGECMMEGVTNLHFSNPTFYPLQGNVASNSTPAATQAGVIYENDRGNPNYYGDYQVKLDLFQRAVSNGWHYPAVNIALTKLCYIDIWYANASNTVATLLDSYVRTLTSLETAYPDTMFVYATMPLTTTNYRYSSLDAGAPTLYWRSVFNDSLRAWCTANSRVLLDIADIEAHDTIGNPDTFTYDGRACQQLWWGNNVGACGQYCNESGDGGHPNNLEAEKLMAKGLYALAAATADRWTSVAGVPVIRSISVSGGNAVISWSAKAGDTYRLQYHTTTSSTNWTDVHPDILAVGTMASTTNSLAGAEARFYRVRLVQ
jgi:hypothetical protein